MQAGVKFSLVLIGLAGFATGPGSVATVDSIVADATSRSAPYCAKFKDGCEVTVDQTEDGWTALVLPVLRDTTGQPAYGIDLHDFYIYDRHGHFQAALRN